MGSPKNDGSLMALYRISQKEKEVNRYSPVESSKLLPCRDTSETVTTMDFVKTWRDIDIKDFVQNSGIPNSTLDVQTQRWKSWTGFGKGDLSQSHKVTSKDRRDSNQLQQDPLYHLTKAEFRRLTEQLRDANWNLSSRFKGIGFNRFKGHTGTDSSSASLYRSQLASSNKAFNDDQQMWRPYVDSRPSDPMYTRCRPVSHTVQERERRPRTPLPSSRRPKSSPIANSRTANNVTWGDYDMLTADIVHNFQEEDRLKSNFGERVLIIGKDRKGEKRVELVSNTWPGSDESKRVKSESSTSGVASLDSDEEDTKSLNETPEQLGQGLGQVEERISADEGQQSAEEEDKSDDERIPEPSIPPDTQKIKVPNVDWGLRPERLDAQAMLEGRKDRHRYDFDASYIRQPRYEFNQIFSPALMSLDLRAIAEREASLELKPTVDKTEAKIMMRCLELEKLQLATERAQDSRFSKSKQYIRQKSASSALSRARAQSAKNSRPGSSKCAQDCTQVLCVGDCPEKSVSCVICNKKSCTCTSVPYSAHTRTSEESMAQTKYRLPRPKSCGPCSKSTNPAKKINLQQNQLGRPKSSHSTYSHAKKSVRQAMDLRASTQQLDVNQIPLDERIHNRPQTSPPRLKSARSKRGRDSVAPHKSYYSQRRVSLTTNTFRPVFEGQPDSARPTRSAKGR